MLSASNIRRLIYESLSENANKERDYTWWDMLTFSVNWKLPPLYAAAEPISSRVNQELLTSQYQQSKQRTATKKCPIIPSTLDSPSEDVISRHFEVAADSLSPIF